MAVMVAAGVALTTAPAGAVGGEVPAGEAYRFLAKVEVGQPGVGRACTGSLVAARWVLTAKACFAGSAPPVTATTVTVGRLDLNDATTGFRVPALRVVAHPGRDLALVELAATVTGVTPVPVAGVAPAAGQPVSVLGFGRTGDEWVPGRPHLGSFTVGDPGDGVFAIAGAGPSQIGPCPGDAGGPGVASVGGALQLVGVTHSGSELGGCLGESEDAVRGGTQTRVDDVAAWVRETTVAPSVNTIVNGLTKLCLGIAGSSKEPGARAVQWGCSGAADQDWQLNPRANGLYEIRNDRSGHCLALEGGRTTDGTFVLQWNCRDNVDQYWIVRKDAAGNTEFYNDHAQKCLALQANTTNGGIALIWPCRDANADQNWTPTARTPGSWVRSGFSDLCMSNGGSTADGAHAVQLACDDANDAEWTLRTRKDDLVEVRNDRSGKCLAIEGGSKDPRAHLLQWPCRDNADQYWVARIDAQGRTQLRSDHSDLCLAIEGGVKTSGAHLLQWNCSANADQFWRTGTKS